VEQFFSSMFYGNSNFYDLKSAWVSTYHFRN
jgi:hypothetical protein